MTSLALRTLRNSSLRQHSASGIYQQHDVQAISRRHLASKSPAVAQSKAKSRLLNATTTTPKSISLKQPISTPTDTPSPIVSSVNGPPSTLPAPLSLPVRQENQSFFPSYLFALGKAYATFYKTGVKNIFHNYKSSRALERAHPSTATALAAGLLSRSDYQLLRRNRHDVRRIPMFALVFMACGEFTPLIVIAISSIVPWTCRIPRQIDADRRKLEKRRGASFRNLTSPVPSLEAPAADLEAALEGLGREQLMHINDSLGLSSTIWDYFDLLLTNGRLRGKVKERVGYLLADDALLRNHGGLQKMLEEEVRMACVERAIDVMGRKEADLKTTLLAWISSTQAAPGRKDGEGRKVIRLLLSRPSVWPVQTQTKKDL